MTDLSVAREELDAAPPQNAGPFAALAAAWAAESERRILWLPAFFGGGIALYFVLTVEPPWWLGLVASAAALGVAAGLWRLPAARPALACLVAIAAGFALIQEVSRERAAPMLDHRLGAVPITGTVFDIDVLGSGWRAIIVPDEVPRLDAADQPRRVRIHIPRTSDLLSPGDRVRLKARLFPVPGQVIPGAHDMQREAYFAQIGAVGYSFGAAHRVAGETPTAGGWRQWLLQLRTEMTRRITAVLPGSTGGVASALITGKRGAVDESVKEAFRESGLSHLLAIAGLHLGLVGAFEFFAVRAALALIRWVALRYPIKKIAAAATLVALICYLMLSGAAIPTERAFVMNGIVFAAILIDRLRISMRICAIAAAAVLILEPESVVGVSFQMSFGAVIALLAVYETWGARLARLWHRGSLGGRVLAYCAGVVVTTVVVTFGTAPYSIYHFHKTVLYSPLANVIAVPLSALWTLPCGVFACLLMPVGLERMALVPMGWGIDATIWVAERVSSIPGNVWTLPRLPATGLLLVTVGGLWLCLWQGAWRRWGVAGIVIGMATMLLTRPPDLVIADLGRFVAARASADAYYVIGDRNERINRSLLADETGMTLLPWPAAGTAEGRLACAEGSCTFTVRDRKAAIVTAASGLPVACEAVDAIVSQVPAGFACRHRVPVVDRIDSWRRGAIALWLGRDGVRVIGANDSRGDRPWVPHPLTKTERAARAAAADHGQSR